MRRPRVFLDVDGVLADFLTASIPILNDLTGKTWVEGDFKTWDIFETVPKLFEQIFFDAVNKVGWCRSLPAYEAALIGVPPLVESTDLFIVTSPMNHVPTWTYEREGWLHEHFGIHHKRVVHTSAKFLCIGDVLVDDRPSNIEAWEAEHPGGLGLLWDQPYNRTSTAGVRVSTWKQVQFVASMMTGSVDDHYLFVDELRNGKRSW